MAAASRSSPAVRGALIGRRRALAMQLAAAVTTLLLLLLASVLLLLPPGAEAAAATGKTGKSGWQKIYKAMLRAPYNVLSVDDQKFQDMVLEPGKRRDFPVVALFTAAAPKYGCTPCHMIAQLLADAATSYVLHNGRRPPTDPLPPVTFVVVDVETAPRTFHELFKLETVPHLFFFPANKALVLPPPEENAIHLDLDDGGANDLIALLKERAGVDYALVPDAGVTIKAAAALAAVLALMTYLILDRWAFLAAIPYNRTLWLAGSYLIFTSAVGGMVYCVIRAPLPFGLRQDVISLFAMQDSQEQFVAEGVIMGVINLMVGLSLVAAYFFASKPRSRVVQFVGLNVSLAVGVYFLMHLFAFYSQKTRWYKLSDTLDPQAAAFFFQPLKRTSGWGKRLWRLTQIWVHEYKDWATFAKTGSAMFINHAKRQLASFGIGSGV